MQGSKHVVMLVPKGMYLRELDGSPPRVFAHTKNMRPRGRSLARNPWLPLRSHETVSQMNQKSLKGCGSETPGLCFLLSALQLFSGIIRQAPRRLSLS